MVFTIRTFVHFAVMPLFPSLPSPTHAVCGYPFVDVGFVLSRHKMDDNYG